MPLGSIICSYFWVFFQRACKSNVLLQLCLRVCQSPECEHHRAAGARKRCGLCRNHPEPADHVKRVDGRRADTAECAGGQWGGGDGGCVCVKCEHSCSNSQSNTPHLSRFSVSGVRSMAGMFWCAVYPVNPRMVCVLVFEVENTGFGLSTADGVGWLRLISMVLNCTYIFSGGLNR